MGWPWSQECLAQCWVGFSQADERQMWRALLMRAEQAPLFWQAHPSSGLVLRAHGPDVSPQTRVNIPWRRLMPCHWTWQMAAFAFVVGSARRLQLSEVARQE